MRLLILYWNELSFSESISAAEIGAATLWREHALEAFAALQLALRQRPGSKVFFPSGAFKQHEYVAGKPLLSVLEDLLGRERVRKLKANIVQPVQSQETPIESLDFELECAGRRGNGITLAHHVQSWAWSIGGELNSFSDKSIAAVKQFAAHAHSEEVLVNNIAKREHAEDWQVQMASWGATAASGHVICELGDYQIIMYPLDHGFPHLHVHRLDGAPLDAKYRVDNGEPLTKLPPPDLHALMNRFIARYRQELLTSWSRCQLGEYPLKLQPDDV